MVLVSTMTEIILSCSVSYIVYNIISATLMKCNGTESPANSITAKLF